LKKGEKKPDGTEVTADAGETVKVKVNDIEKLFKEIESQKTTVKDKLAELNKKNGSDDELGEVLRALDELERKLYKGTDGNGASSWKTEKQNDLKRHKDFLKDAYTSGTGTTAG
jgi:hypothetical protein